MKEEEWVKVRVVCMETSTKCHLKRKCQEVTKHTLSLLTTRIGNNEITNTNYSTTLFCLCRCALYTR